MKGCRPLTDDEVSRLLGHLGGSCAVRNRALFLFGLNTGRRITQILSLRVRDVVAADGGIVDVVYFRRKHIKGKIEGQAVYLNDAAKEALTELVAELTGHLAGPDAFLFQSSRFPNKAIDRKQAWRILKKAVQAAGLTGKVSCHSMRKSFADRVYDHGLERLAGGEKIDPFRLTSKALGHMAITSTESYLSFRERDVGIAIQALNFRGRSPKTSHRGKRVQESPRESKTLSEI